MLMIYPGTYQFPSDHNSTEFSWPKFKSSRASPHKIQFVFSKSTNQQPILLDTLPTMVDDDRDDDSDTHDVGGGDDGDKYDDDGK